MFAQTWNRKFVAVQKIHASKIRVNEIFREIYFQKHLSIFGFDFHVWIFVRHKTFIFTVKIFCSVEICVAINIRRLLDLEIPLVVAFNRFNPLHVSGKIRGTAVVNRSSVTKLSVLDFGIKSVTLFLSDKNVSDPSVIIAINESCTQNLRGMRQMVWGRPVNHRVFVDESAPKIVDVGVSLRTVVQAIVRSKNIVVHKARSMRNLNHQIAAVFVIDVRAEPCSLCLPIKPSSKGTVVDIIVPDLHVDCRMELDSSNLIAEKFIACRNVENLVSVNLTEDASQMPDNSVLPAVIDFVPSHDMSADSFFAPTDVPGLKNSFHLILIARLQFTVGKIVVPGRNFFSQTDSAAFCVVDYVVFDNPTLAPVCSQKSVLHCRRWCPLTGCLSHFKSAYGDIVNAGFLRKKAAFTHVDFAKLFVRIMVLEIRINYGRF